MGSQNLIARTYDSPKNIKRGLQWQELMTRLTGPVVAGVNAVFLSDWFIETGERLTDHVPANEIAALDRRPTPCCARSCPADRRTRPRTTCACSSR